MKLIKLLYILSFTVMPLIFIVLLFYTGNPLLFIGGSIAILLLFLMTMLVTKKYLDIEYEYVIVGGEMTVDIIYGGKSRKTIANIQLKNVSACGKYSEENCPDIDNGTFEKIRNISSSSMSNCAYYITYEEEAKKYALIFDTNEKVLDMLKLYCRGAMRSFQ